MMLRGLEVEQVRRFGDPVRLNGLGPGLNLLAAPNEFGKSTLLAALRAVFMLQHGSKSEAVRSLQPYGNSTAPRIAADFSVDGTDCRIEKRFVSRPSARLTEGGRVLEGDEAEERLQRLIGLEPGKRGTEALGILSALWVGQGQSLAQPDLSDPARATVRTCLEADLGAMTGGAEAERILARVRVDLAILQDGRGNPKGRYRAAIEGEAEAAENIARLDTRRRMLEDDLAAMAECRRRLAHEDNADRRAKEHADLAEARRLRDRLRDHDALYRAARAAQAHAAARVEAAGQDVARRAAWQAALDGETARLADLADGLGLAEARHAAAQAAHAARRQAVEAAERACAAARRELDRVEARLALARLERERHEEATRLDRLDRAEAEVTRAALRLAACTMDDARMATIRQADRAVQAARAASRAQATVLDVLLEDGTAGRLVLDGRVLQSGRVDLTDSATLHIDGVGTIRIEPASRDRDRLRDELAAAEDALHRVLDQAGCADPDAAEIALAQRRQADLALNAARSGLAHLLPADGPGGKAAGGRGQGTQDVAAAMAEARRRVALLDERIAHQRAALPQGPDRADTAAAGPDADVAAAHDLALRAMQGADARAADARQALFAPDETLRQAAADLARLQGEDRSAREVAGRLARDMAAARAAEADDALSARLDAERAALAEAEQAVRRIEAARPDGTEALADAAIRRQERIIEDAQARLGSLRQDMAALEARIHAAEGDGLDERIAGQERLREAHAAERAACAREVAILHCLRDSLTTAERAATERYLAPLCRAVQPALAALFPRAGVTMEADFSVSRLMRRLDEPFDTLSDGTREQIAVLVRLGLADLLRARGRPAMLVLDDALTYSDAGRLDRLFDILTDAADRMQIIVLTCRAELFTGLGARSLTVEAIAKTI